MIEGVKVKELVIHKDERGQLMEILRKDDDMFKKFGQVYVTTAKPGYAKAWHYHKNQTDHFCCIKGKAKVVLYDNRDSSKTKGEVNEFILSMKEPKIVQIPPGVFHGFESATDEESMIVNVITEPYNPENPDEFRVPFNSPAVPYEWDSKKGG